MAPAARAIQNHPTRSEKNIDVGLSIGGGAPLSQPYFSLDRGRRSHGTVTRVKYRDAGFTAATVRSVEECRTH
jgi:hypothetical protein